MGIPLLLDEIALSLGIHSYIEWEPQKAPHVVIFGSTGSGKTYLCKLMLGKISLYEPVAEIYVCDFKGDDDFTFLEGGSRFFRFNRCKNGLQEFYERFQARQDGTDKSRNMLILYFDEWASYCNSNDDKKALEAEKRKLATILMLGRSFRVHIIISQQRPDAAYFNAARDNFNLVISLGNLSEEGKNMIFHEYKKLMLPNRQRGTGYMLINGTDFTTIQVSSISNLQKLQTTIQNGVTR